MEKRIDTKVVFLTAMSRQEYHDYRDWKLPDDQNGEDIGYLVEDSKAGYKNDSRHDGHISWWPKDKADQTYTRSEGLSFGQALEALEIGEKVSREGWNGVGLWLELQRPDEHSKMTLPYIYINYPPNAKTTPGAKCPWFASQTDMLAKDWLVVE